MSFPHRPDHVGVQRRMCRRRVASFGVGPASESARASVYCRRGRPIPGVVAYAVEPRLVGSPSAVVVRGLLNWSVGRACAGLAGRAARAARARVNGVPRRPSQKGSRANPIRRGSDTRKGHHATVARGARRRTPITWDPERSAAAASGARVVSRTDQRITSRQSSRRLGMPPFPSGARSVPGE